MFYCYWLLDYVRINKSVKTNWIIGLHRDEKVDWLPYETLLWFQINSGEKAMMKSFQLFWDGTPSVEVHTPSWSQVVAAALFVVNFNTLWLLDGADGYFGRRRRRLPNHWRGCCISVPPLGVGPLVVYLQLLLSLLPVETDGVRRHFGGRYHIDLFFSSESRYWNCKGLNF